MFLCMTALKGRLAQERPPGASFDDIFYADGTVYFSTCPEALTRLLAEVEEAAALWPGRPMFGSGDSLATFGLVGQAHRSPQSFRRSALLAHQSAKSAASCAFALGVLVQTPGVYCTGQGSL